METSPQGLTGIEAQKRLKQYGFNLLKPPKKSDAFTLLLGQFKSPIILILIIVLVIRTRRPFLKNKPGKALTRATVLVTVATLLFPYTPLGEMFVFSLSKDIISCKV
jgi:Mg2+-importing ATPase